jgi:hypothetical protein
MSAMSMNEIDTRFLKTKAPNHAENRNTTREIAKTSNGDSAVITKILPPMGLRTGASRLQIQFLEFRAGRAIVTEVIDGRTRR